MKWFVGIDMAKLSHCICIEDETGKIIQQMKISNDLSGFKQMAAIIEGAEVYIALEKGHGLIVEFLKQREFKIYSINPRIISRFKESLQASKRKDDWKDAEALSAYLRLYHKKLRPIFQDTDTVEEMRGLCEVYNRLIESKCNIANKLNYVLENYFPLYLNLFSVTTCETLWKMVIKFPNWDTLKKADENEILDFLRINHYRNKSYISILMEKISQFDCFVSQTTEKCFMYEAVCYSKILLDLEIQIKELKCKMESLLESQKLGEIFLTIPGAGNVIASHLLALFGDNYERFQHYNHAQSYFGTAPSIYQSGNYCKVMMRRSCNKMGRRIFYQLAFCSITKCKWARNYYDELRKRGKRHSSAIRAVSNKWVKIVFSMWKNKKTYDPTRFNSGEDELKNLVLKTA